MKTCTLMIIPRSTLPRTRNISGKTLQKKSKHILRSLIFFSRRRAVYNLKKKSLHSDRPQMTWRMRFACWWLRLHTHSDYVILTDFPRQQWLCERASMLRLYVHCLPYIDYHQFKPGTFLVLSNKTPFVAFERVPSWSLFRTKFWSKSDMACQSGIKWHYYYYLVTIHQI